MRPYGKHARYLWLISLMMVPGMLGEGASLRDEATAYRAQGYEAQSRDDATAAVSWYQKAAELDPAYATPHNDLGVLFEAQGRWKEARRSYERALARRPDYAEAHGNLAMLYERMGRPEDAARHWFKRAEFGGPFDPGAARAEERLKALGLWSRPSTEPDGSVGSESRGGFREHHRRRVVAEAFAAHAKSLEMFRALTGADGTW
jgi:tetratricopeptide (TPR) repeat protein